MTGIIIGTNRIGSLSEVIAKYYKNEMENKGHDAILIDLKSLPEDFIFSALYGKKNVAFDDLQSKIDQCSKLVFIVPEYNGSYPGVLKSFIEGLRHPDSLSNKKACLVGVSTGVLGNAVGLGHLSDVLSYLNANLLGLRVKLGLLDKNFKEGEFTSETYKSFVERQINLFLEF
jgi:NAD(P)H-dependent FMN reductase